MRCSSSGTARVAGPRRGDSPTLLETPAGVFRMGRADTAAAFHPTEARGAMGAFSPGFRIVDHTADVAVEATGGDFSELLANAARGMFSVMADTRSVRAAERLPVEAEGTDLEGLLVGWLGELVFLSETRCFVFSDVDVMEAGERRVRGEALGEPIDFDRHSLGAEIKAVTYHGCEVSRGDENGPWRATVLFDI